MSKCNLVLTHGGTGTIIRAIRYEKKVIAIPRLKIYGEHVDDHQIQVTKKLQELNHILTIEDLDEFEEKYHNIYNINFEKFISNTQLIDSIRDYIDSVS
jgi:UDP-N-acetylglucosamine transferase subunit ALG13